MQKNDKADDKSYWGWLWNSPKSDSVEASSASKEEKVEVIHEGASDSEGLSSDSDIESPAEGQTELQIRAINFVRKRRKTIETLKELEKKTESFVWNCKVSNTVGNAVAILGLPVAFLAPPVGISMMVAGGVTSLGTTLIGSFLEQELKGHFKKIIEKDEAARKVCVLILIVLCLINYRNSKWHGSHLTKYTPQSKEAQRLQLALQS